MAQLRDALIELIDKYAEGYLNEVSWEFFLFSVMSLVAFISICLPAVMHNFFRMTRTWSCRSRNMCAQKTTRFFILMWGIMSAVLLFAYPRYIHFCLKDLGILIK